MHLPERAGIYCRLSYAPDGSEEKVDRQEADCRDLASRLRWPISEQHIFRDNSRSAWSRRRRRPDWDRMLRAVQLGEIDSLLVYHGDRLIRQPFDLETLINVSESKGVRIASPSGTRDLDNADDRFILRIEAAQACRESDNTSRRVKKSWSARAAQGKPSGGGRRPFGFEPDLETLRIEEAELLAAAAERLVDGRTLAPVLRWLDERSTTSMGMPWSAKTLKNLLRAPRIAGLVEHQGVLYPAVWDPIISRERWEDVNAVLDQSAKDTPHPGRERRYLLSGIAECAHCGAGVYTKPTGGRNRKSSRIYVCRRCRGIGRNVDLLDRYVEGRTLRLLNAPKFLDELFADDGRSDVGAEITALERRKAATRDSLENIADHADLDPGLLAAALSSFDRKIADLRDRAATSTRQRVLVRAAGITREQWDDLPLDVRSETIRALIRIVIHPTEKRGPGFDPTSVRITRRTS